MTISNQLPISESRGLVPASSKASRALQILYFIAIFFLFLALTSRALFWGTQKLDGVEKYNLQPDERTALGALSTWNYPQSHWEGAAYFNLSKLVFEACEKLGFLSFLQTHFDLQGNGPILLVMRFLNMLLIFFTGFLIFVLVFRLTGDQFFAHAGMLIYMVLPSVQVSGHYMRSHILTNFVLTIFLLIVLLFYRTADEKAKSGYVRWMFVLSGILFSLRYPFLSMVIVPLFILAKSREYGRIARYLFLTFAAAFIVNPFFFIHLRTSFQIASMAPPLVKFHSLMTARSAGEFFARLQPIFEIKSIFLRILPNSSGGLIPVLILCGCTACYFLLKQRDHVINWLLILSSGYLCLWIFWGQTITDGLSRFSLPLMIVLSLLIPFSLHGLSSRFRRLSPLLIGLAMLLILNAALFSAELLFEMGSTDTRFIALSHLKQLRSFYVTDNSWDYGLFTKMEDRVKTIRVSDAHLYPGAKVVYVDISIQSRNPFEKVDGMTLQEVIEPVHLFGFWKDSYYLHDYKYFAPNVYIFDVRREVESKSS